MRLILLIVVSFILSGCYTQFLTANRAVYKPLPNSDSTVVVQDTLRDTLNQTIVYPARSGGCTPYEIQRGLCWSVCDRCGYYHKYGYRNCPRSYRSSWAWDYYNDYPWWYSRSYNSNYDGYYRDNNNYYNRRSHSTYHHSGSSSNSGISISNGSSVPEKKDIPKIHNKKVMRSLLFSKPASTDLKKESSTTVDTNTKSTTSSTSQSTYNNSSTNTSSSDTVKVIKRPMKRKKRLR